MTQNRVKRLETPHWHHHRSNRRLLEEIQQKRKSDESVGVIQPQNTPLIRILTEEPNRTSAHTTDTRVVMFKLKYNKGSPEWNEVKTAMEKASSMNPVEGEAFVESVIRRLETVVRNPRAKMENVAFFEANKGAIQSSRVADRSFKTVPALRTSESSICSDESSLIEQGGIFEQSEWYRKIRETTGLFRQSTLFVNASDQAKDQNLNFKISPSVIVQQWNKSVPAVCLPCPTSEEALEEVFACCEDCRKKTIKEATEWILCQDELASALSPLSKNQNASRLCTKMIQSRFITKAGDHFTVMSVEEGLKEIKRRVKRAKSMLMIRGSSLRYVRKQYTPEPNAGIAKKTIEGLRRKLTESAITHVSPVLDYVPALPQDFRTVASILESGKFQTLLKRARSV